MRRLREATTRESGDGWISWAQQSRVLTDILGMKTRLFTIFFAAIAFAGAASLLCGCKKVAARSPDAGVVAGQTYSNAFFGFSLPVPAGWSVAPADTANARDGSAETHQLLLISEKPLGVSTESNPTLLVVAEQVSASGATTARDYLQYVTRILSASIVRQGETMTPYTRSGEMEETPVGGRAGGRASFTVQIGERQARQTYFSTVIKGYALSIVVSAMNEADLRRLEGIAKSARFAQR